jgi:hypothetical protein
LADLGVAAKQSELNEAGATDHFGNPLKVDGLYGPKILWAQINQDGTLKGVFSIPIKRISKKAKKIA